MSSLGAMGFGSGLGLEVWLQNHSAVAAVTDADAADAGEMQGAEGQGKFTHRALLLLPLAARSRA